MKKEDGTSLHTLLETQVAAMYYAEKQLVQALGALAKNADNGQLKEAFAMHLDETKGHVERLETVFKYLGKIPYPKACPGIDGIIEEGAMTMGEFSGDAALDASLIAAGQKAQHYEIATYGSMCGWAKELGLTAVEDLLHQTLEEERSADEKLSALAESIVNTEDQTV